MKAKKLYFSVGNRVSLFVCSIIASIISGFDKVAKMVNPAIKKPIVVMEKLKPNSAHFLTSLKRLATGVSRTIALRSKSMATTSKQVTCELLGFNLVQSLKTSQSDFSLVNSSSEKLYTIYNLSKISFILSITSAAKAGSVIVPWSARFMNT